MYQSHGTLPYFAIIPLENNSWIKRQ